MTLTQRLFGIVIAAIVLGSTTAQASDRSWLGADPGYGMRSWEDLYPGLDLTPEQRERIDLILKESQERTRKIMEPVSPQIRDELQRVRAEFRAVLTPEQQVRFDELARQQQRPREPRRPGVPEPRLPEENRPRPLPPR